jgi:hypothetical protein
MKFLLQRLPEQISKSRFIYSVEGPTPQEIASMTPAEVVDRLTNSAEVNDQMQFMLVESLVSQLGETSDANLGRLADLMMIGEMPTDTMNRDAIVARLRVLIDAYEEGELDPTVEPSAAASGPIIDATDPVVDVAPETLSVPNIDPEGSILTRFEVMRPASRNMQDLIRRVNRVLERQVTRNPEGYEAGRSAIIAYFEAGLNTMDTNTNGFVDDAEFEAFSAGLTPLVRSVQDGSFVPPQAEVTAEPVLTGGAADPAPAAEPIVADAATPAPLAAAATGITPDPAVVESAETLPVSRELSANVQNEMRTIYEAHGLGDFFEQHVERLEQSFRYLREDADLAAAMPALERYVTNALRTATRNSHATRQDSENLLRDMNILTQSSFRNFVRTFRNDPNQVAATYLNDTPEIALTALASVEDRSASAQLIERGEDPAQVATFIRILEQGLAADRGPLLNLILTENMSLAQAMEMAELVGEINRAMEPLLYTDRLSGAAGGSLEATRLRSLRNYKTQILAGTFEYENNQSRAHLRNLIGGTQEITEAFVPAVEITDETQLQQAGNLTTLLDSLITQEGGDGGNHRDLITAVRTALRTGDIEAAITNIQPILEDNLSAWFEMEKGLYARAQVGTGEHQTVVIDEFGSTEEREIMRDMTASDIANSDTHLATYLRFTRDTQAAARVTAEALQAEGAPDESAALADVRGEISAAVNPENLAQFEAQAQIQVQTLLEAVRASGNQVKIAAFQDFLAQGGEAQLVQGFQENLAVVGALESYIQNHQGQELPAIVEMYDDMMGISPDEWSDAEVRQGWDNAMMASMLLPGIGFGGYILRGGQLALRGLNGAVKVRSALQAGGTMLRATLGFSDEAGRLAALSTALNSGDDIGRLMAAARTAGTSTDEVYRAALSAGSSMDDIYATAGSMDEFLRIGTHAGNRSQELLRFAMQNGASMEAMATLAGSSDDLVLLALNAGRSMDEIYAAAGNMDDFIRLAVQATDRSDEVLRFVMQNGAAIEHIATLGGTFDDIARVATQSGRLDEALTYGLQSGTATIDDLFRAGANMDDVLRNAQQASWSADNLLAMAVNGNTSVDRIVEVSRALSRINQTSMDDVLIRAVTQGGESLNGVRMVEVIRAAGGNVDELMKVAQAQGVPRSSLSIIGRAAGHSDEVITNILSTTPPNVMDNLALQGAGHFDDAGSLIDDGLGLVDNTTPLGGNVVPIRPNIPRPQHGLLDNALISGADELATVPRNFEIQGRTFARGERVIYETAGGARSEMYVLGRSADGGVILTGTPLDEALMRAATSDEIYRAANTRPNTFAIRTDAAVGRVTQFGDEAAVGLSRGAPAAATLSDEAAAAVAARTAAEVPAGSRVISMGRARELFRSMALPANLVDDLGPRLAAMRSGVANSADDFMNTYRGLPLAQQRTIQLGLLAGATPLILSLLPENFLASPLQAEETEPDEVVSPGVVAPNLTALDPATTLEDAIETLPTQRSISVTATNLRFRSTPSLNGDIVGQFNPDSPLQIADEDPITAEGYVWQKVIDADGNEGYIAVEDEAQTVQYAVINEFQGEEPDWAFTTPVSISSRISFRTGPGTNNDRVGYIDAGSEGIMSTGRTHIENGYIWAEVQNSNDDKGWIALSSEDESRTYAELDTPST